MPDKELNIKSSTVEKGLEIAKEFLGKLIAPTIEEVGLLLSENVKYLRFKNQIRILLKAKQYVESKNIPLQEIPIKVLVPLLEKASLEDEERMQDKWAKMLANLVNSEKNLQNQVFPYILSQVSLEEYNALKELASREKDFLKVWLEYSAAVKADEFIMNSETRRLQEKVEKVRQEGFGIDLEEYEQANLLRLGLVRQLPPKIFIEEFATGEYEGRQWHNINAEYDPDDYGFRVTELGKKFLEICELD